MLPNTGVIYVLISPIDNKIRYVGQTIQPLELRLKQHLWYSIKNRNHLGYWLKSLNQSPIIKKIDECETKDLDIRELQWISFYKDNDLVNSMKGCSLSKHHIHSEETKRKIGEATKRLHTGRKRTEETKNKIRIKALGRKQSKSSIEKRIKTMLERGTNICSENKKEKIRKANTGKVFSKTHKENLSKVRKKSISVFDLIENRIYITCIKDFAKSLNVYPNSISDRLKRYPDRIYKSRYYLSKEESELRKLMKQLGIIQ